MISQANPENMELRNYSENADSAVLDETVTGQGFAPKTSGSNKNPYILLRDNSAHPVDTSLNNSTEYSHQVQRLSRGLTNEEATKIHLAAAYAGLVGFPLYRHLIIRWLSEDWLSAVKEHEYILRKVSEWLNNNVGFQYFVWVKECNGGPHTHYLLYLPDARTAARLKKSIRKWLKAYHGIPKRKGWPRKLKCKGLNTSAIYDRESHHCNQLNYITKRCADNTAPEKQDIGIVVGKPCGVSQLLGPSARSRGLVPSTNRQESRSQNHPKHLSDRREMFACEKSPTQERKTL
jgi:hypothetical protein